MRVRKAAAIGSLIVCLGAGLVSCGGDADAPPVAPPGTGAESASEPSAEAISTPTSAESAATDTSPSATAAAATSSAATSSPSATSSAEPNTAASSEQQAAKVEVDGRSVNVRCSGTGRSGEPTVILLAGMPDPLTKFDALQATLSYSARVCSYDRLGEGASDAPTGPVSLSDSAAVLDGVLRAEKVTGKVFLVGHSLGGLVAAEYAHRHQRTVAGVLLLDATPPSVVGAIQELIPSTATGVANEVRGEMTSLVSGKNPERLVFDGTPVGSIGAVPLTVVRHGQPIFAAVPVYGADIEKIWVAGQRQWTRLSSAAKSVVAPSSGHYIYSDQLKLVVQLISGMLAG